MVTSPGHKKVPHPLVLLQVPLEREKAWASPEALEISYLGFILPQGDCLEISRMSLLNGKFMEAACTWWDELAPWWPVPLWLTYSTVLRWKLALQVGAAPAST